LSARDLPATIRFDNNRRVPAAEHPGDTFIPNLFVAVTANNDRPAIAVTAHMTQQAPRA
jgi:hypothetical protein